MERNSVVTFENEKFGEVRTMVINGEPWFVGRDVADKLGYERPAKAIKDHVDLEDRDEVPFQDSIGRMQKTYVINESGLYSLILSSKLPSAKEFKHWVSSEVLPSIRKTGGYISDTKLMVSTYFGDIPTEQQVIVEGLLNNIVAQQNRINSLETTNGVLTADILSWADRNLINALVRRYAVSACNGEFGSAWIKFKKELLYKYSVNINSRITAYANRTGKKTKPRTLDMINDDEVLSALKTIVSMCENKKVDITDLLNKHKEGAELVC